MKPCIEEHVSHTHELLMGERPYQRRITFCDAADLQISAIAHMGANGFCLGTAVIH